MVSFPLCAMDTPALDHGARGVMEILVALVMTMVVGMMEIVIIVVVVMTLLMLMVQDGASCFEHFPNCWPML